MIALLAQALDDRGGPFGVVAHGRDVLLDIRRLQLLERPDGELVEAAGRALQSTQPVVERREKLLGEDALGIPVGPVRDQGLQPGERRGRRPELAVRQEFPRPVVQLVRIRLDLRRSIQKDDAQHERERETGRPTDNHSGPPPWE